jgi:hypothetical protein
MSTDQLLLVIGLIGIGGIITAIVNHIINLKKSKQDSKNALKETRYKAILLLCFACVN